MEIKIKQYIKMPEMPTIIEAVIFPDDGPGQHDVGVWVEGKGGKLNLYDGMVEKDVETSTGAKWRWKDASLVDLGGSQHVKIGDYITKQKDGFQVFSPDVFEKVYITMGNNTTHAMILRTDLI